MSSTPTSSSAVAPSSTSSRVQSANNKTNEQSSQDLDDASLTKEKSSRPPSAQKIVDAETSPGAVAVRSEENNALSLTQNGRPSSVNKQSVTDVKYETRPGSAAKNSSHGTVNRPPSAIKTEPMLTPTVDAPNIVSTTTRPPSASQKQDGTMTKNTASAPTTPRPASGNKQLDHTATDNNTATTIGSRPPSANKKSENMALNNDTLVATGSRPSSAARKAEDISASNTTTEPHDPSTVTDPNDPKMTKPIIGRPSSAAKKTSHEGPFAVTTLVAAVPLSSLVADASSSSDNHNQVTKSIDSPSTT